MATTPELLLDELVAKTKNAFDEIDEGKRRPDELQQQAMAEIWDLSRDCQADLGRAAAIMDWPMAPLCWTSTTSGGASTNRRNLVATVIHYIFNDRSWCGKQPGSFDKDGVYRRRLPATT